jgi:large subunit ribosomal protein L30
MKNKQGGKHAKKPAKVNLGAIAVIRIRGRMSTFWKAEHTMLLLNLSRKYHCALLPDDAISRGMVERIKDYVTFGYPSAKAVEELFLKAGKTVDGKALTDDYVKEKKVAASVRELAASVASGATRLSRVDYVKPIFRLKPSPKGFGSIKAAYPRGALGKRDEKAIDALILSML